MNTEPAYKEIELTRIEVPASDVVMRPTVYVNGQLLEAHLVKKTGKYNAFQVSPEPN